MVEIIGGVDTHADTHTVAALDGVGRLIGHQMFPTTPAGYAELRAWLLAHGEVTAVGVEGTGSYGAGLARYLRRKEVEVLEVDRPDRRTRRRVGKSDPVDAIAAARAVLAGTAATVPKTRDGVVESIRTLRVARASAVKAHTAALNALHQLVITAPEPIRERLRGMSAHDLVETCARLRPEADLSNPVHGTKRSVQRLARRCQHLATEIAEADVDLEALTRHSAPRLLERVGVGPQVAAQLLITAGDNPDRIHSDASFAALCGTNPLPASSGRTHRHRINHGGDRAANSALYTVVIVRMRYHQPTRDYVERRTTEGLSKREIIRCLKRYVARELLPLIREAVQHPETATNAA